MGKTYRYFGNKQKSVWFFKYFTTFRIPDSRFYGISEEERKSAKDIHDSSNYILRKAIYFNLSDSDPSTADKLFGWAAENFTIPENYFNAWTEQKYYDDIAVAYLWRSYALLNLGKYEEAHELLVQVVPYLDRYKKRGLEMWHTIEYTLPKALIPLCEYKLNPTEENLTNAKKGIEDFIKSLRDNRDKLEAYLYYFHLKEKFADVYEAESVSADAKPVAKKPVEEKKIEFPVDDEEPGTIMITTLDRYEDFLGSNSEVENYCAEVSKLGDFPNLALLMETYVTESYLDAEPLIEECKRLLAIDGVEDWIREMTEIVLEAAEDAKVTGNNLYFYFAEDIVE